MVAADRNTFSFPSPPPSVLPSNWRPPSMIWSILSSADDDSLKLSELEAYSVIAAFTHYARRLRISFDSPGRCLLVFAHRRRGLSYRWVCRLTDADVAAVNALLAAITDDELARANRQPFSAGVVNFAREVHA